MTLADPFARAEDDALVAVGGPAPRSGRALCAAAFSLSAQLSQLVAGRAPDGAPGQLLLQCDDRYHFAVGLLGAWHAGLSVALPASRASDDNRALAGMPGVVACALDHAPFAGTTVPTIDLPALVGAGGSEERATRALDPRALAATLYTSGSTGQPRGVPKRFDQLLGEAALQAAHFDLAGQVVLSTVPAQHIYGLLWSVLSPLLAGGCMVRTTPNLPAEVLRFAQEFDVDVLVSVPAHLAGLAGSKALPARLRRIVSSGAPLAPTLAQALEDKHGVAVVEILGSTETGGIAHRSTAHSQTWQPLPGIEVRADADAGLWVRSPFADAGANAESPCQDRVRLLPGGGFEHLGRADSIVKVGARRVDLADLRARLCQLKGVRDAYVLALPVSGIRGHDLACVLEADAELGYDRRSVRAALRAFFDPAILPRVVRTLPALPRAENGKVQHEALRALLASAGDRPPGGPEEVAAVFELSVPRVHEQDGQKAWSIEARVRADAFCFDGHFPDDPILPGVVQLNNLVVPVARGQFPQFGPLCGARALKFKTKVRPGDALTLSLQTSPSTDGGVHRLRFRIERADELCASGTLHFQAGGDAGEGV